jgi:hypothetical protein
MASNLTSDTEYKTWLWEIKLRIRTVQIKAAVSVNSDLLRFHWGSVRIFWRNKQSPNGGMAFFLSLAET